MYEALQELHDEYRASYRLDDGECAMESLQAKRKITVDEWFGLLNAGMIVLNFIQERQDVKDGEDLTIAEAMQLKAPVRVEKKSVISKINFVIGNKLALDEVFREFK